MSHELNMHYHLTQSLKTPSWPRNVFQDYRLTFIPGSEYRHLCAAADFSPRYESSPGFPVFSHPLSKWWSRFFFIQFCFWIKSWRNRYQAYHMSDSSSLHSYIYYSSLSCNALTSAPQISTWLEASPSPDARSHCSTYKSQVSYLFSILTQYHHHRPSIWWHLVYPFSEFSITATPFQRNS